jgi:hypothetical protein
MNNKFLVARDMSRASSYWSAKICDPIGRPLNTHCYFDGATFLYCTHVPQVSYPANIRRSIQSVKISAEGECTETRKTYAGKPNDLVDLKWNSFDWNGQDPVSSILAQNMKYYLFQTKFEVRGIWAEMRHYLVNIVLLNGRYVPHAKPSLWKGWPTLRNDQDQARATVEFKKFKEMMELTAPKPVDVEMVDAVEPGSVRMTDELLAVQLSESVFDDIGVDSGLPDAQAERLS